MSCVCIDQILFRSGGLFNPRVSDEFNFVAVLGFALSSRQCFLFVNFSCCVLFTLIVL